MLDGHPGQWLVGGVWRGLAAGVAGVLLVQFATQAWCSAACPGGMAVPLLGGCLLGQVASLSRPLLMRTLLKHRRSPFVLDGDLDQGMVGRAIGVVLGVLLVWGMAWQ